MNSMNAKVNRKILKKTLRKDVLSWLFIAGGGVVAIVLIFWIWQVNSASQKDEPAQGKHALRTDIPDAEENTLPDDKRKAYEDERMRIDVNSGAQNLGELFPALSSENGNPETGLQMPLSSEPSSQDKRSENYQKTQEDFERSIAHLNQTVIDVQSPQPSEETVQPAISSDEELLLQKQEEARNEAMERFDAMMQKYMPQQPAEPLQQPENPNGKDYPLENTSAAVSPVAAENGGVSSSLYQKHRGEFYGSAELSDPKNTIKASVYGTHVIESGQFVRFRMEEPMQVGKTVLPAGSLIIGKATVGEDRLFVGISSIEHSGVIYSVSLDVYDTDGMPGLYLPGSMEMETVREIGSDVAGALGSSAVNSAVFQTQTSAAEQLKTEVGRGLIQGSFRYLGRKLQTVKITVQDKHKVYLLPNN